MQTKSPSPLRRTLLRTYSMGNSNQPNQENMPTSYELELAELNETQFKTVQLADQLLAIANSKRKMMLNYEANYMPYSLQRLIKQAPYNEDEVRDQISTILDAADGELESGESINYESEVKQRLEKFENAVKALKKSTKSAQKCLSIDDSDEEEEIVKDELETF